MLHSRPHIEEGDFVILYFTRDNMVPITVTPGQFYHNKFGRYAHEDMIGMKFGAKMYAPAPHRGYIFLLRPTPELWTLSLPHRTQILYIADIAFIIQRLGIRPGSTVIEAGTGSGSMTHSLSRAVGSRGKVRSFEYHEARCQKAKEEFENHKLSNVQVEHRNVCKNGFADARDVQGVFLDLPAPWEAIPHTIETFRDGIARICCFSPCLEQVLKTVSSLRENGFEDITTQEVLIRTHEIVAPPAPNATPLLRSVSSIVSDLQAREAKKQERRILQMKTAREKSRLKKLAEAGTEAASSTRNGDEDGAAAKSGAAEASDSLDTTETHLEGSSSKSDDVFRTKRKSEEVEDVHEQADSRAALEDSTAERSHANPLWTEPETNLRNVVLTRPSAEMRGHTSYLTFATFYPETIRQQLAAMVEVPTGVSTPVGKRVEELVGGAREDRAASQDTDYGSEGIDEVMGTLTEEDMMGMGA